jgi:hypothetical protein
MKRFWQTKSQKYLDCSVYQWPLHQPNG